MPASLAACRPLPFDCVYVQVAPFSFMMVKPIGVLQMLDQGERDDKIIAVHLHDPAFNGFNDISELPGHRLAEIRNFFEDYKLNENKVGWPGQNDGSDDVVWSLAHTKLQQELQAVLGVLLSLSSSSALCHPQLAHGCAAVPVCRPTPLRCDPSHTQAVRVDEILGAEKAKEVIEEAIQMYVDSYVPKKYRITK